MTPTLAGRWQTRILLFSTVGVAITFAFGLFYRDFVTPFALIGLVFIFGFAWDIVYQALQVRRWDRDWPPLHQWIGALWEGVFVWGLTKIALAVGFPTATGLPGISPDLALWKFAAHYGAVWVGIFICTQGPLRVIFPGWRFRGGQWR